MNRKVLKIGGSILKNEKDLKLIRKVIIKYPNPPVVVVSALFGTTDLLEEYYRNRTTNGLEKICEQHFNLIDKLYSNKKYADSAKLDLQVYFDELKNLLHSFQLLKEIPEQIYDLVLSYGEKLSAALIKNWLQRSGMLVELKLPEEIGLITNGLTGDASVNYVDSSHNLKKHLRGKAVSIIPGFYGISSSGKITLLGRGGSDYSAASIARCIDADSLDVWKDVSGFSSCDPKEIDSAVAIPRLSFQESSELAYFGARILHPRTVEPLLHKKIPIGLFNLYNYNSNLKPDTVISDKVEFSDRDFKAITFSKDFAILSLNGPAVGIQPGIMAQISSKFTSQKINIKSVVTTQTRINLLLSIQGGIQSQQLMESFNFPHVDEVILDDDIAVIAVVGEGITSKPGIAAKMINAVSNADINIKIILAGASDVAIYCIVSKQDCKIAVESIHTAIFENKKQVERGTEDEKKF